MGRNNDLKNGVPTNWERLVNSIWWTLLSFAGGLSLGFLALTEFRAGPIIAGLGGLAAYFLIAFAIPKWLQRRIYGDNRSSAIPLSSLDAVPSSDDPRVDLLVEAHQHAAILAAATQQLPLAVAASVDTLHKHAIAIIAAVSAEPSKLAPVLRFFTYYLPSTSDLVMDRIKLATHAGSTRLGEIDQTLLRLIEAFAGFEAAVLAPDLHSVDLDVELLDQALNADLEELKR